MRGSVYIEVGPVQTVPSIASLLQLQLQRIWSQSKLQSIHSSEFLFYKEGFPKNILFKIYCKCRAGELGRDVVPARQSGRPPLRFYSALTVDGDGLSLEYWVGRRAAGTSPAAPLPARPAGLPCPQSKLPVQTAGRTTANTTPATLPTNWHHTK